MDTTPRQLSPKILKKLQKASWSEWLTVFNQVHNSTIFTSVGTVNIEVSNEKENRNTKKSKIRNR